MLPDNMLYKLANLKDFAPGQPLDGKLVLLQPDTLRSHLAALAVALFEIAVLLPFDCANADEGHSSSSHVRSERNA